MTPSFKALFEQYIAQFNAHSIEGILACLSPSLQIFVRGDLVIDVQDPKDFEKLKRSYQEHWEVPNVRVEIHELKEMEDGVETKLIDFGRMQLIEVRYVYAENEDEKWLHVRHEIGQVTTWTNSDNEVSALKSCPSTCSHPSEPLSINEASCVRARVP